VQFKVSHANIMHHAEVSQRNLRKTNPKARKPKDRKHPGRQIWLNERFSPIRGGNVEWNIGGLLTIMTLKSQEESHTCHSACLCQHRMDPTVALVTPTRPRSPHAKRCLCNACRQTACEACHTQSDAHKVGKWRYYCREEVLCQDRVSRYMT
jgi:hypothetical protein